MSYLGNNLVTMGYLGNRCYSTDPKSSRIATFYAWCDQLFIFVSIVGMIIETLPDVKEKIKDDTDDHKSLVSR